MGGWQRRVDRANALARAGAPASALLTQYAGILAAQRTCYDALVARGERLTGLLGRDLAELRSRAAEIFEAIAGVAPTAATRDAPHDAPAIDALLVDGWRCSSIPFLARIALQPYAEALAQIAARPQRRLETPPVYAACPFCGGPPQVAVFSSDSSADGGGRTLVCATCATAWPVRRVLCVGCGEEDERRLRYANAVEFDHVRVDTCDTCRHYIKTVDLTRLGLAVPIVDEVASGALDIWAQERGYTKVTPNLIGL